MEALTIGLIVAGGAQAVAGILNYYNAQKARKADEKKLAEIRAIFEKIVPPDYDLTIDDPPALHTEQLKRPEFAALDFDMTKLTPAELKVVSQYSPTLAPYIAEAAPQLVQESADAKAGRQAQKDALQQYRKLSEPGAVDPGTAMAQEMARRKTQIEAQSREQSIAQDWQRRGMLGAGLGMAGQMQASSSAMDRLALENMEAAKMSQQQRLQALAGGAALGGQIRNQDMDLSQQNAAIINAFNQRTAAGRQGWEQQRAGSISEADLFNNKMAQGVAEANWGAQNKFALDQQARQDALKQYIYNTGDARQKWGFDQEQEERNYSNQTLADLASWKDKEKSQQNTLLGQGFDDKYKVAAGVTGAAASQAQAARQGAQDQAQAFQGMANMGSAIAMGGGQGHSQQNQYASGQAGKDDRKQYDSTGKWMTEDEFAERKKGYGG